MAIIKYFETPVMELRNADFDAAGVRVLLKREDLNHPFVSGNKWWKLKPNLEYARAQKHNTVLTFGGAFSNHIYSTAAGAKESRLKSIGIIRGEETFPLNSTLTFAKSQEMQVHYISREAYRNKDDDDFIKSLREQFGSFYLIPEGGTNDLAVRGCAEFATEKLGTIDFDYLCLPVATGGTMAGIIAGCGGHKEVIGVSVLKKGDFLAETISSLLQRIYSTTYGNWKVLTSYDHGGYAKVSRSLTNFIDEMKVMHGLPLDEVYTGKLLWAVAEEVRAGRFRKGSTVLVVHTGGLQGKT